jgi:hypothetical protein
VAFEQATLKVEKQAEFEQLKSAIARAFRPEKVETFLKLVQSKGLRVRDFDALLARRILEYVDKELNASKVKAQALYQALSLSDQAQMREFYLFQLEEVGQELRTRFQKIYRYY